MKAAEAMHAPPWIVAGVPDSAGCIAWVFWNLAVRIADTAAAQPLSPA